MATVENFHDVGGDNNTYVRQHLRNMVCNLENVLGDLQGVVGDLRVLVHQIDSVTNKLDERYGYQWRGEQEVTCTDMSPNGNTSITNMKLLPNNLVRKSSMQEWSPEIDFSFLNLSNYEHCSNWGKLLSKAIDQSAHNGTTGYGNMHISESTDDECETSSMSTDDPISYFCKQEEPTLGVCTEFDKTREKSPCQNSECEGSHDICKTPLNPFHINCQSAIATADSDGYCGIYEAIMESQLECVPNVLDSSDSECESSDLDDHDTASPSAMSFSDEYFPTYNRDVNTWTSYTLMPVTDSSNVSDDGLSETCSDILNDNLFQRSTYDNAGFQILPVAATV